MPPVRLLSCIALPAAFCMLLSVMAVADAGMATAQTLNQRETASPAANAKVGRALTKARSKAAEEGEGGLNRETINAGCGPVEIGNKEPSDDKRRTARPDEQEVVITSDVVVVCR